MSEPEGVTTRICQYNVSPCVCVAALECDVPTITLSLLLGHLAMTITNTKWSSVWTRCKDLNVGKPQSFQLLVTSMACCPLHAKPPTVRILTLVCLPTYRLHVWPWHSLVAWTTLWRLGSHYRKDGSVHILCGPTFPPGNNYIALCKLAPFCNHTWSDFYLLSLVVFGDSGNANPQFTISSADENLDASRSPH